jgi:hypothetical protein
MAMNDMMKRCRIGSVSEGDPLFFPDPLIDKAVQMDLDDPEVGTGILCTHCHKEIKGRLRQYNNQYFDSYCWNLRFILKMGDEEEQRPEERRSFLSKLDRGE